MKSCFHQPVHRRPVQAAQCPYREKSGKRGSLPRLYAADYPLSDAQETADALKDLALRLCGLSEESGAVRHAEVVDFIQMYVRKHYARPDMSLEQVAGEVKLSRGYVGKLFKAHCELSFNDYLNAVRLEKARELLASTEESVQSISEQVGILNTTYFYTLFKSTTRSRRPSSATSMQSRRKGAVTGRFSVLKWRKPSF